MGESELREALRDEADASIREFWQEAEASVSERRGQIAAECELLRTETDRRLERERTLLHNNLLFAAQARAQKERLHTETALQERLLLLAHELLEELAEDRTSLWQRLSTELPVAEWTKLTVHPEDQQRAGKDFPTAMIECDASLGGGLIASHNGLIEIDNSLRIRLLRAWPDLLPQLFNQLRKQVDEDEATHSDQTG